MKEHQKIFRLAVVAFFFFLHSLAAFADESHTLKKPKVRAPKWTLSATMIFQNDAPYLKEWIEFHRLVGVEHFYLYNNRSSDDFLTVLYPYLISGEVDLIDWPHKGKTVEEWDAIQCGAYQDALKRAKKTSSWLAVIDSDEFLVPVQTDDLRSLLIRYEQEKIGGVYAYWVVFGTSFVKKIPSDRLLIETLLLNGGRGNGHFKSIVRPAKTASIRSPHYAIYKKGFRHVEICHDELQINHYWSRDEWYLYNFKIPRRAVWGTPQETCILWGDVQNNETPEGEVILRFAEHLRLLMGLEST